MSEPLRRRSAFFEKLPRTTLRTKPSKQAQQTKPSKQAQQTKPSKQAQQTKPSMPLHSARNRLVFRPIRMCVCTRAPKRSDIAEGHASPLTLVAERSDIARAARTRSSTPPRAPSLRGALRSRSLHFDRSSDR